MADFDARLLRETLLRASRTAFAEVRARHKGETFYCMGLFTTGLFDYLLPTAMTEEGLDAAVREYQKNPQYAKETEKDLRSMLRWSPCDSPFHLEGERHFRRLDAIMRRISSTLAAIDIDHGWDEFEDFVGRVEDSICEVLVTLDEEGTFGTGEEREKVFVTMLMGDQDDSILEIGRRLNPASTVQWFEREWV